MPELELSVVPIEMGVGAAIDQLRKSGRSALLAKQEGGYDLFSAGNIVVGRSEGAKMLSDLTPDTRLSTKVVETKSLVFGLKSRLLVHLNFGVGTKQIAPDHILVSARGGGVLVNVPNAALVMKYLSGPKDYYCNGPRRHDDFPPPTVSAGDRCPHGDGYTIVSSS